MYLSIVLLTDLTFPECEVGDRDALIHAVDGERGLAPLAQFVGEHEGDHPGGARHTRAGDIKADQGEQQGVTQWRLVARLN